MQADTTPDAESARLAALRKLTGAERVQLAIELSELVRALELAGRRDRAKGGVHSEQENR